MLDYITLDKKYLAARPAKEPSRNVITPICRISFPNLFKPRANKNDKEGKLKFGVSLLVPPEADLTLLRQMCNEVALAEWGAKKMAEFPKKPKTPFINAGDYKYEGYVDSWTLLRCTAVSKPDVGYFEGKQYVKLKDEDTEEVYPGRWAQVTLNAFIFDNSGNRGVSFGLNNVLLLNHDEKIGGRMTAENEFEAPDEGEANSTATIDSFF